MNALRAIMFGPLSVVYGAVTATRLQLYRRGLLAVSQLAAPVVSVGNITTGGTGKTPLVEFIARSLAGQQRRVCVLTRGYGRENPSRQIVVSDAEKILASVAEAGDEPMLLAKNLLGAAAVISNADRHNAGVWAIGNLKADAFVLDDGFQHLRLARHLNILVIDATQEWKSNHLLPWGQLREPRKGISRADCVVITRADQSAATNEIRKEIEHLAPNTPIFTSRMTLRRFGYLKEFSMGEIKMRSGSVIEVPRRVAAFCGVANPNSFFEQLQSANYQLAQTTIFPDHHKYTQADITKIVSKARDADLEGLVTTAKDAVKLQSMSFALPCYVMEIEISIDHQAQFLEFLFASLTQNG